MSTLSYAQVEEAGLQDWRLLHRALQTRYRTDGFATGLALVNAIGEVAEEMDHHPDLDLRWGHLNIRLTSHDADGVTGRDVRLARKITHLASDAGVQAVPEQLSSVEIGLDTPDHTRVSPFWAALLGAEVPGEEQAEVHDRSGDLPLLWFQPSGSEEPRQRFHFDVTVPAELAQERIDAAVAAGGRVVSQDQAPAYVVLEDADGNRACVCTMADPAR